MVCRSCGHENPDRSRYCNQCGKSLTGSDGRKAPEREIVDHRWIYIDLFDLKLPATMRNLDDLSTVVSYVYERFTPFADDGWEWVIHPSSWDFDGWVYQEFWGTMKIAGVHLLCKRVRPTGDAIPAQPLHHVSQHRTMQLVDRPWTAEPGAKIWKAFQRGQEK